MGLPVTVTVADLVMEEVEERALSTCTHKPLFWKRYVDDTVSPTIWPDTGIPPPLEFYWALDPIHDWRSVLRNHCFLDTMVSRHDYGSISTTVFRKKTHTNHYLDFSSNHPLAPRTLLTRADRICTFQRDRDTEKEHVSKALESWGYPKTVIRQHWRSSPTSALPPSPKATITLPYVRHLAKSIRILSPQTSESAFAPIRDSDNPLCSSKTAHPPKKKAVVVY